MTPARPKLFVARARARLCALAGLAAMAAPAHADKISNPVAVFDGLDKITGRIISFEVAINETVQFGTLQVTPRVCYSRPPTDAPQTDAFAQVDELDEQKKVKPIFSGWMFANSPGLHGVEHPIYDIWLINCKGGTTVIHDAPQTAAAAAEDNAFPGDASSAGDAAQQADPTAADPQKPIETPRKRKPRPAVAVAPPPQPLANAPLNLGGGDIPTGNARSR